jgi:antitoxin component YwqK of YwqJK toxin-antitoxin module
MGRENVERWLEGGARDSILYGVPGASVQEKQRNFFKWMVERKNAGGGTLAQAYANVQKVKKVWESLPPYKKADREDQERYQRKIDAFYGLVKMRIEQHVDNYIADNNIAGTVATGSRDMMVQILLADFTNGLNRELGGRSLNVIERQAAQEAGLLAEIDDWMYGLFSGALDSAWDAAAALRPRPVPATPGRWGIKVSEARDEGGEVHAEAQVVPPVNQTFEERITLYELAMVGAKIDPPPDPASTTIPRAFKVTVEFELTNKRTGKKLASATFEYKKGDLASASGVGHYVEYLGGDPKQEKREEFDFILLPPDEFFARASKILGKTPTKEERNELDERNLRMVMSLDEKQMRVALGPLAGHDKKKVDDLINQIGQGLVWIFYHGTYIDYLGGRKDYQREFKEGIAEGEHIAWHPNGKVKEKGRLSANEQVGEWRSFDESERPLKTEYYEKGEVKWVDTWSYHSNGRLAQEGPRKHKRPDSTMYPDLNDGAFIRYYANGEKEERGQYNKGRQTGTWERWSDKGIRRFTMVYTDPPDPDRAYCMTVYDEDGNFYESGCYDRNNQKHGEWIELSDGKKVTRRYNHGR